MLEIYTCGIRNPGLWNPKYNSVFQNPTKDWNSRVGIQVPLAKIWNPVPGIWNPRRRIQKPRVTWSTSRGATKPGNRDFKFQRRERQRERQKTIGLMSKTTTSHVHHTFLYISFPFLHDYDEKMPNFAFYGGRKQATMKFSFSF